MSLREYPEHRLWGRSLRFVLVEEIRQRHTMTVAAMVELLATHGYGIDGRPSKVISDALRWEVARGRVIRVRRGVYRYGRAPRTTERRIRLFASRCHAWLAATTHGTTPPPTPLTPPERLECRWHSPGHPSHPPWQNMGWLWSA